MRWHLPDWQPVSVRMQRGDRWHSSDAAAAGPGHAASCGATPSGDAWNETHNTHMASCLLIPAVCFVQGKVWDGVFQSGSLKTSAFRGKIDGIPVVLLRPDWGICNIFRGGAIYGGAYNELEAYLYFSRWQTVYMVQMPAGDIRYDAPAFQL